MPDGVPTSRASRAIGDEALRAAGMSRQKIAYLRDLCEKISTRALDLDALDALSDEDVDQRARHGQGHRPLVGGDVPDLPAASARRAAGRRSGDRDRRAARVSACARGRSRSGCARLARRGGPYRSVASLVFVAQPRQPARPVSRERQSQKAGLIPPRLPGAGGRTYNRRLRLIIGPLLGGRSTVGHHALDVVIGVRIPASQPRSSARRTCPYSYERTFGAKSYRALSKPLAATRRGRSRPFGVPIVVMSQLLAVMSPEMQHFGSVRAYLQGGLAQGGGSISNP